MKPHVMLLGMPRSGTTWIAKIVDSHPRVAYFHEPDSVFPLKNVPLYLASDLASQSNTDSSHHFAIPEFLAGFPYIHEKCLGKRPFFHKDVLPHWLNLLMQYTILISKAINKNLIIYPKQHFVRNKSLVCFKSIESVGRLGAFLKADKSLKIVFIIRSPFGQIHSVLKGSQAGQFDHNDMVSVPKKDLKLLLRSFSDHKFSLEQVLEFTPLQQLALRWLAYNEKALREAEAFSNRVHIINYDQLCDSALAPVEAMFQFLGLSITKQSTEFLSDSNKRHQSHYYSVVKDAETAKNAWRNTFSDKQIEEITSVVAGSRSAALLDYCP